VKRGEKKNASSKIAPFSFRSSIHKVVEEIVEEETPDFVHAFLDVVKVHFQEMIDSGRYKRRRPPSVYRRRPASG
jgi:hypothetical protein